MRQNGVRSNVRFPYGKSGMKSGGKVGKKKQGYKDRKDEVYSYESSKEKEQLNNLKMLEMNLTEDLEAKLKNLERSTGSLLILEE